MPQYDIYNCIGFLATGLREYLSREFDRRLLPLGLNYRKAGILWVCYDEPHTQVSLCSFIQSDKNYVRLHIDELESAKLVKRKQNPNNRRENLITLTQKGRECAKQTYQIMLDVHTGLLSPCLSTDEISTLQALLHKAFTGLESQIQKEQK